MPEEQANNGLHLPDLTIKGFRGIKSLSLPRLGRVTLLAGKNSVGKTTVLEAVSIFAARCRNPALYDMLARHDELSNMLDGDGEEFQVPDTATLFHRRDASGNTPILIGPSKDKDQLTIKKASFDDFTEEQQTLIEHFAHGYDADDFGLIKIVFMNKEGREYTFPQMNLESRRLSFWRHAKSDIPAEIKCETLGPGLPQNEKIARFFDKIALSPVQERAVEALRLILGDKVDGIAIVGEEGRRRGGRRAMVKIKDHTDRVPLKSLGDGAVRLFSVALALANTQDGILLIDEAENGIHHSVQPDFWRMVLRIARENNTQVLATTHSWDCVRSFAEAAIDDEDAEGILFRLERDDEDVWEVFYPEERLKVVAEQGIEVR